jgi:hypothetical protein
LDLTVNIMFYSTVLYCACTLESDARDRLGPDGHLLDRDEWYNDPDDAQPIQPLVCKVLCLTVGDY